MRTMGWTAGGVHDRACDVCITACTVARTLDGVHGWVRNVHHGLMWHGRQVVCTIGPATWDKEKLFKLADEGMNVARLNMSHGDHKSHKKVRFHSHWKLL